MANEQIKTRLSLVNKHDSEANWHSSKYDDYIPKQGEFIVYDIDDNYDYERLKIGDGVLCVQALPFISSGAVADGGDTPKYVQETLHVNGITWNRTIWNGGKYEAYCTISNLEDTYTFTVDFPDTIIDPFVRYDLIKGGLSFNTECETTASSFTMSYDPGTIKEINLTVTGTGINYGVIEGDKLELFGAVNDVTITSSAEVENFAGVMLNNELLDKSNYTVTEGSTKVTLKGSYLKTLPNNLYTIKILSKTGVASCTLDLFTNGLIRPDGTKTSWEQLVEDELITATSTEITSVSTSLIGDLYLPQGVQVIENNAFQDCQYLTSVVIPDSVTSIGYGAFAGCTGLTAITIPFVGATKDGTENTHFGYIFGAATANKNTVDVPHSLKVVDITGGNNIDKAAFRLCQKLTKIMLPDSVTSIGDEAFLGCKGLTTINIPYGVTSIGSSAFHNCTSLTSIDIPNSVTSIGYEAFYNCSGLTSVTISNSVAYIGTAAFCYCTGLTTITLPFVGESKDGTGYTHFGYIFGAEDADDNLTSVPASLSTVVTTGGESFDNCAFYYCTGLTSIVIPDSVTSIGTQAFKYCTNLTDIYYTGTEAEWDAIRKGSEWDSHTGKYTIHYLYVPEDDFDYEVNADGTTCTITGLRIDTDGNIVIPEFIDDYNVTAIDSKAFYDRRGLVSVRIPDSVTYIGGYAFYGCADLTDIYYTGTKTDWDAVKKGSSWNYNTGKYTIHFHYGKHEYDATITNPTCTEPGYTTYTCSVCGDSYKDNYTDALGHTYSSVVTDPTCTKQGYTTYTCTTCGYSYRGAIVSETGHTYGAEADCENDQVCTVCGEVLKAKLGHTAAEITVENEVAATCTTDGSYDNVVYCATCEKELQRDTITVHANGHVTSEVVVENKIDATCTTAGSYDNVTYCTVCEAELSRETVAIEALGHTEGEVVVENSVAADCVNDGSYDGVIYCAVCNAELSRNTIVVEALGHTNGEVTTENYVDADCTNDGSYDNVIYCTVCGAEVTRDHIVIPAKGHTEVIEAAFAPTCTKYGLTEGSYCSVCMETIIEQQSIPPTGHTEGTEVVENYVAAGCTNDGYYDKVVYCTVCKEELSRETITVDAVGHGISELSFEYDPAPDCVNSGSQNIFTNCPKCGVKYKCGTQVVSATGHNLVQVEAKTPTCTEAGHGAYEHCSKCAYTSYTSFIDIELPALGHTPGPDATCTEPHRCTVCDTILNPAGGHSEADAVTENYIDSDCLNVGSYESVVYCSVCGEELSRTPVMVPAKGHSYETAVTAPTCTEKGINTFTCQNCEATYTEEIAALGHTLTQVEAKAPTCTEIGWDAYEFCSECDYTTYVEIPATDHVDGDITEENRVESTCTTPGSYDSVIYCTVCNTELLRETIEIPVKDHTYETAVTNPTCTEKGYTTYTCSVCGDSYIADEVAATGHNYEKTAVTAPTCTTEGYTTYTCTTCDDSYTSDVIAATGHTYTSEETKAPTCTEKGTKTFTCSECGHSYTEEIPATGHSYEAVVTAPKCTEDGYTTYTCSVCGDSYTNDIIPYPGHKVGPDATCTEPQTCLVCGVVINPAGGHIQGPAATCTTDQICQTCGEVLVEKLGHNYAATTTAPTCTEQGYTTHTCTRCSTSYVDSYVDALGHTAGDVVVENYVEATTTADGSYDNVVYCTICKTELSRETVVVPATGTPGLAYEVNKDGETCTITGLGTCTETEIFIPEFRDDYRVTTIGAQAFKDCASLISITIPDSVVSIDTSAFQHCTSLKTISLSNNLASIGEYAFGNCSSLTEIEIPASVTEICDWAFQNNIYLKKVYITDLEAWCNISFNGPTGNPLFPGEADLYLNNELVTQLEIPDTFDTIKPSVFCGCKSITNIVIPDSVTSIGKSAFRGCKGFTEIVIPDSVTSIGGWAFYNCDSLTEITIPDSVTSIGDDAFYSCDSLTEITIPDSVRSISKYTFGYCTSLTSIVIPDSVTSIGDSAFAYCTGLTEIVIPDSVTSIGERAFYDCTSLTSAVLSNRMTSVGYFTFGGCTSLTSIIIPDSMKRIGECAFDDCTGLTEIVIPDSVTSIGRSAFSGCTDLTSVVIGTGCREIGEYAFSRCSNWLSIYYAGTETQWATITKKANWCSLKENTIRYRYIPETGFAYNINVNGTTCAITGFSRITEASVTIPEFIDDYKVTAIGSRAFQNHKGLAEITIPSSITHIGASAFVNCFNITSVYITDLEAWLKISINDFSTNPMHHGADLYLNNELVTELVIPDTFDTINSFVFHGCKSITNIVIPDSVKSISDRAFCGSSGLSKLDLPNSLTTIGPGAFAGSGLTEIVIPDSVTSLGDSAFYYCTGLSSVVIGKGVTSIGYQAFYNCDGLTEIVIPDSVTSIGDYAFSSCYGLTEITIPDSVTSIGDDAFSGSGLTSIVIPDSVTYIGEDAFIWCPDLTSVVIGNGCKEIGEDAFHGCDKLISAVIGGGDVGDQAFSYCDSLAELTICEDVTSIGDYAFAECKNLMLVTMRSGVTSIGEGAFGGCTSLASIDIPDSVTFIDNAAFAGTGLASVVIPSSVTTIGCLTFANCENLTTVVLGPDITDTGVGTFYYCTNLTEIILPNCLNIIGMGAFYECTSLTEINIPDSVTYIGAVAFQGCERLYDRAIEYDNAYYIGSESNPYLALILAKDSSITSCNIHERTKALGGGAFSGCHNLTSIVIPNSVKSIGEYAFSGCTGLTEIVIPDSVTTIGNYAFENCTGLTDITIPDSVTSFGETLSVLLSYDYYCSVFEHCTNLANVVIGNGIKTIGSYAFSSCTNLASIVIPNSVTTIGERAFSSCTNLASVVIGNNVTSIGYYAFSYCTGLKSVELGDSVTSVGEGAFHWCDSLPSIVIPDSVTSIGYYAFYYCRSLTSVVIPDSVTSIGYDAFYYCTGLTDIYYTGTEAEWNAIEKRSDWDYNTGDYTVHYNYVPGSEGLAYEVNADGITCKITGIGTCPDTEIAIPESIDGYQVTAIDDYAFDAYEDYSSLTSIIIPAGVTSIGKQAFYCCSNLVSVVIPDSVTYIGEWAFANCGALIDIYYPGTGYEWDTIDKVSDWDAGTTNYTIRYHYGKHVYYGSKTPPTCTERGYTTYTCVCGDKYVADYVDATGHTYTAVVTAPTCTERGYTTHICACGDSYVDSYVDALHNYKAVVTEPTCVAGYTTYICDCGDSYVDNYVDPAYSHSYSSETTKEPTCTEEGEMTFTCQTCGDTYTDKIDAIGHIYERLDNPIDGKQIYKCELCGDTYEVDWSEM